MSDTLHVHYESPSPLNLPPELLIKIAEVAVSLSPSNDESIVELENARAISFCCHALRDVGQKRLFRRIKTDKQLEEVKKSARLAGFVEEVEWMFCDKDEKTIPQRVGALTILVGSCANLLYVTLPYIPFLFLPTVLFYLSSVRAAGALTNLHLGCSGNGATNWNGTDLPLFLHALTTFRSLRSLTLDLDLDRIFPPEPETWAASYASLPPPPELALDDEEEGANEPTASPVYFPFLTHLVLIQHNWSTAVASGLLTLLLPTVENVELRDHGVDEAAFFRLLGAVLPTAASSLTHLEISTDSSSWNDQRRGRRAVLFPVEAAAVAQGAQDGVGDNRLGRDDERWSVYCGPERDERKPRDGHGQHRRLPNLLDPPPRRNLETTRS